MRSSIWSTHFVVPYSAEDICPVLSVCAEICAEWDNMDGKLSTASLGCSRNLRFTLSLLAWAFSRLPSAALDLEVQNILHLFSEYCRNQVCTFIKGPSACPCPSPKPIKDYIAVVPGAFASAPQPQRAHGSHGGRHFGIPPGISYGPAAQPSMAPAAEPGVLHTPLKPKYVPKVVLPVIRPQMASQRVPGRAIQFRAPRQPPHAMLL